MGPALGLRLCRHLKFSAIFEQGAQQCHLPTSVRLVSSWRGAAKWATHYAVRAERDWKGVCVYRQTDRHGERFILRDLLEGIVGLAVLKSAGQTDGWRPQGELLLLLKFTDSRGRVASSSETSPFFYHDLQLIGRGPPLYGGQSA